MSKIFTREQVDKLTDKEFEQYVEKEITYIAKQFMTDPAGASAEWMRPKFEALTTFISYAKTREMIGWNRRLVILTGILALANVLLFLVNVWR